VVEYVEYKDKQLVCVECGQEFTFTAGEQLFFADRGLSNEPKRCRTCKQLKNERMGGPYGWRAGRPHVEVKVKCAICEVETTVPFHPSQGRPVYCRDCFKKMREEGRSFAASSSED